MREKIIQNSKEQLTDEQIKASRYVTSAEIAKEWEELGLCAPGNAGINPRCKEFKNNCNDCSIDYANQKNEHISIFQSAQYFKPSKEEISAFIETIELLENLEKNN